MADRPHVVPGNLIGVYRLTELIGKGGFSEVWSAWDTRLKRLIAIKIFTHVPEREVENSIRFNREANIVSRLEHPHILPLYDFGEDAGHRYLVMRYATGGSLAEYFENKPGNPQKILYFIRPIAAAMDYVHQQRIVHRDVKPNNILLDAQGAPYLSDFGLSRELTDATQQFHSVTGTLPYMSPEQFAGESLTTQSDLYSFGLTLFQLFTGTLPYDGQMILSVRQINFGENLPSVIGLNPALPPELDEILLHLTRRDPKERPGSAVEVIESISKLFPPTEHDKVNGHLAPAAVESPGYHQREAEILLDQALSDWKNNHFTLSHTHFMLLDTMLETLPSLLNENVRSLMLCGALEYDHQLDHWWAISTDEDRKRACLYILHGGTRDELKRALPLVLSAPWVGQIPDNILDKISENLDPNFDLSGVSLELLELVLPASKEWSSGDRLNRVDDQLSALAASESPLAQRAAMLIGSARRTRAVRGLPIRSGKNASLLIVYETAGSLPQEYSPPNRIRLFLMLAFQQLTRRPIAAVGQYIWAAVGNMLGIGSMVYAVLRSFSLIGNVRILNGIGQGLLFGMIYGLGVWLARHISQHLRLIPLWARAVLGTVIGGLIVAAGFSLFAHLVYDDSILPTISILCGMLYVWGFAISVELPTWAQIILGAGGVIAAYLVPWTIYVQSLEGDVEIRPPFIFDLKRPTTILPLVISAALVLSLVTLGYLWLGPFVRKRLARMKASVSAS